MNSLCQLASERAAPLPPFGSMVEPKIDGLRMLFFRDYEGKPCLWSRQGMPFRGTDHILRQCIAMEREAGHHLVIDGEFFCGSLAASKAHFERDWRNGDAGDLFAFDCLPLAAWERDNCPTPLHERKTTLSRLISATAPDPAAWEWEAGSRGRNHGKAAVRLMPEHWCEDDADLAAYVGEIWRTGGEGAMVKDAESVYRRARSPAWRKVKCRAQLRLAA